MVNQKAFAKPLRVEVVSKMLEEQLFDEMRHAKWLKKKILELEG